VLIVVVVWAIVVILFIAFMIITHEAGHFFAAKAVGITPKTFSIGFGPEIVGWDRGGTRYAIKWFLIGGSVQILGMNPDEEISDEDWPHSYYGNPPWKRAVAVVAGSFVHICIAFFLLWLIFWPIGYQVLTGRVGEVQKTVKLSSGSVAGPGYAVGIKKGDLIRSVDGVKVRNWDELSKQLQKHPGEDVTLVVERGGGTYTVQAKLLDVDGRGILGIVVDQKDSYSKRSNPFVAIGQAGREFGRLSVGLAKGLGSLFSLRTLKILFGTAERNRESPQSIVGATRMTFQAAGLGISVFLYMVAYLFFFLAIFNLLPLPPLDGGHLLVIFIEKVFGKRIDMRKLVPVAWAVFVVLSLIAMRLAMLDIFKPLPNPFK
jgi:membrane-associated protease RseP (regulator of RpoE activity)